MPLSAVVLALVLGALSALAMACGDTSGLLSERRAARLTADVDRVAEAVRQGDCDATAVRLQELQSEVADLPSSVSADLRGRLADGVTELTAEAEEECQGEPAGTTETEPPPAETVPPETQTQTETEPPPAQTETTETEPEPEPEPEPTEPTPPAETTPPAGTTPAPDPGAGDDGTGGGAQGDAGTGGVDGGTS